jgi:hypothetical protein
MTETEWLACTDPDPMLDCVRQHKATTDRKLELFAVACWYRDNDLNKSKAGWAATCLSEQRAETLRGFTARGVKSARRGAKSALSFIAKRSVSARRAERAVQARLLRCIVGGPFHPPPSLPPAVLAWKDGTVPRIAQAIYDERAFDRLPILADALEDAGCADADILSHCRSAGPHVRGCWVVDLILGKQ